jgi:predicted carbohydrate-binding protein with CBM5 and CBM33 domain
MIIRRLAAVAGAATLAGLLVPAPPAGAHGSPTSPISRTAACAQGGTDTGAAACKAAKAANGGSFGSFDNLRIANVNGDDRKAVPDGKLCSGGLDAYRGLDLVRDDFPATAVSGGDTLKINYRATIPHAGQFRVYLTEPGYDPGRKLTWDDLGSKPILRVTDPPLTDGAYHLSAKLPPRTGRQILYIVWETSSTPDTYYSCSDLRFKAAAKAQPKPAATKPAAKKSAAAVVKATRPAARTVTSTKPSSAAAAAAPTASAAPPQAQLTPVSNESTVTLGHQIIAGAVLLGAGALAWGVAGTVLRRRRENR